MYYNPKHLSKQVSTENDLTRFFSSLKFEYYFAKLSYNFQKFRKN